METYYEEVGALGPERGFRVSCWSGRLPGSTVGTLLSCLNLNVHCGTERLCPATGRERGLCQQLFQGKVVLVPVRYFSAFDSALTDPSSPGSLGEL